MAALLRLLLATACALGVLQPSTAQWASSLTTQIPLQILSPNPITCQCSDVNPRDGVYYNVSYTCLQQVVFGNCEQHFIRDAVKELAEGYCQVSCGRCPCCNSVADVLKANNANALLLAAAAAGLDRQLAAPASMFTLLAPTDAAFAAALPVMGFPSLQDVPQETVAAIVQHHIIPPHPAIDAVWTTPFLRVTDGAPIPTVVPGATLTFATSGGVLTVKGTRNSATIIASDIEACKSYINVIDAVLLPPESAQPGTLPVTAGNIGAAFGPAPSAAVKASIGNAVPPIDVVG